MIGKWIGAALFGALAGIGLYRYFVEGSPRKGRGPLDVQYDPVTIAAERGTETAEAAEYRIRIDMGGFSITAAQGAADATVPLEWGLALVEVNAANPRRPNLRIIRNVDPDDVLTGTLPPNPVSVTEGAMNGPFTFTIRRPLRNPSLRRNRHLAVIFSRVNDVGNYRGVVLLSARERTS